MLSGRANDIKRHRWFDGFDWDGVITRKMTPPRKPRDDSSKRLKELTVRSQALPQASVSKRSLNTMLGLSHAFCPVQQHIQAFKSVLKRCS